MQNKNTYKSPGSPQTRRSHPEPTPITPGMIFLCSTYVLKTQTSFHIPWVSPAITSGSCYDCISFYNSLQSLLDRFLLALRLPGNVCQQDLPLQKLPHLCWEKVCIWPNYPIHHCLFPGWKKNFRYMICAALLSQTPSMSSISVCEKGAQ